MKIQTECVPCLLKRIIFEAEQSTKDPDIRTKVIKNACKVLSKFYDPNECSATIATKVHKIAYETLGDDDPYKDLKNLSNKVAQSLVPRVEEMLKESIDPLKTSMTCSIVGNTMDFGIEGGSSHPEALIDIFEKTVAEGLGHDDTSKIEELLKKSKHVMLFADNCGEIVFDKILCRELKKFNSNIFIILIVRGEPIISDATMKDAEELKFKEVVDEVLTTGCFAIGVDFKKLPLSLKKALEQIDLIICKGMANYESFSETDYRPIAYLLRTKCTAIANSMNLPLNINAVKLYE
ncbi:MAG: ARMT1-like domain-containing protein [Euryarchaeota archaeon]|nr:ARMT1-like domain-containing protein [Euryarchaeota archaeon]